MNLIDIAEQLKNAPDQLLVREVQQPTGNYPAYLVIAEMARRKKMRESMPKEMPKTTVAEDLAAQSRVPQMQVPETPQRLNAGIMQAPQATQDMAAQDAMAGTPLPKAMAGGGLVAFENGGMANAPDLGSPDRPDLRREVERRLAMDLGGMSARPVRKATGYDVRGMTDFGGIRPFMDINQRLDPTLYGVEYARPIEGGRLQAQATYDPVTRQQMIAGEIQKSLDKSSGIRARGMYSPQGGYGAGLEYRRTFKDGGEVVRAENGLFAAPVGSIESSYTTPEEVAAYQPMFPTLGEPNTDYQLKNLGYTREQIAAMNPATKQFIVQRASTTAAPAVTPQAAAPAAASSEQPAAPAAPATPPLPTFRNPYAAEIGSRLGKIGTGAEAIQGFRYSTPQEMEAQRVAGTRQFQEENPFLFGFLKEDIQKRQRDVAGRRQSNINEALMEAGLRIAASKSPRFLGALGEGGLGALKSYKEGIGDIRKAEEAITQSKVQFAQAETLYNQNKFNAGDKKMQQAMDNEKRGLELMSTQQAARVQAVAPFIQAAGAEREAFLAPYLAGAYQTQGRSRVDTTPSPTEIKAAKELATADLLKEPRLKVGTPEAERFIQERTQFYLMQSGKIYSSPVAQPVNRGTL